MIYRSCPSISTVDAIAAERSYKNRDEITVSPGTMGSAYEDKVKIFFNEHLHEDEEIRYILDGQGFFDVRDGEDSWIRIRVEKDDLIILPAGLYHRFTTDTRNVLPPPLIPVLPINPIVAGADEFPSVYQSNAAIQGRT